MNVIAQIFTSIAMACAQVGNGDGEREEGDDAAGMVRAFYLQHPLSMEPQLPVPGMLGWNFTLGKILLKKKLIFPQILMWPKN